MRYRFVISYDGTAYYGFQRQNGYISIQETIEKALKNMTQQVHVIHSAGRTDKGVHAKGQVFHVDSDLALAPDVWIEALHKRLPLDIRIKSVSRVPDDFHARHSAKSKVYHYVIAKKPSSVFTKNYEVYVPRFDIEKVMLCPEYFVGTRDFQGFSERVLGKPTIKTLYQLNIKETKTHYIFQFHGNGFLKYMVRSMMGLIIEIGQGKKSLEDITKVFETRNRALAGKKAEARGLFLMKIYY